MAGLVEEFCLKMLPETSVEFLTGLCDEFRIVIPGDKADNKAYLVKVVLRHLTSADIENSEDQGTAIFLKLYNELGGELKPEALQPKQEAPLDNSGGESIVNETLSYRKLRLFKINGTIGDPGQKNCVSYSSLCYQIDQGEAQGYSIKEIYDGVIRAIEAGNPFRDVLELEADSFNKAAFLKSLKSHFMIRDPNEVLNELRTAVQSPSENAHRFCCRCVALKKKIVKMYESDGIAYDEENLSTTFYRSIYTGLRQRSIRDELRAVLKEATMSDEDLLVEVSLASANEEERLKKMGGRESKIQVNQLTCDSDSDDLQDSSVSDSSLFSSSSSGQNKNASKAKKKQAKSAKSGNKTQQNVAAHSSSSVGHNSLNNSYQNSANSQQNTLQGAELGKMAAAIEKLSSANAQLTADICVLKSALTTNQNAGFSPTIQNNSNLPSTLNPTVAPFTATSQSHVRFPRPVGSQLRRTNTNRPIFMCELCVAANSSYCRHCFRCKKEGHRAPECPEN